MKGLNISVEVTKGTTVQVACDSAKELSELCKQEIDFTFNGVKITTQGKSINEMIESYTKAR